MGRADHGPSISQIPNKGTLPGGFCEPLAWYDFLSKVFKCSNILLNPPRSIHLMWCYPNNHARQGQAFLFSAPEHFLKAWLAKELSGEGGLGPSLVLDSEQTLPWQLQHFHETPVEGTM